MHHSNRYSIVIHHKDYADIVNQFIRLGFKVDKIIVPLALTQSYSILEQLEHGIRYLDLRVFWNGSGWYLLLHFMIW